MVNAQNHAMLEVMAELHKLAFENQGERGWKTSDFHELMQTQGTSATVFIRDDCPIAFTLFRSVLDEAELITVCVAPTAQGEGVGASVLHAEIDRLKENGIKQVFLEVRKDNERAQKLYKSLGFDVTGIRKEYYQNSQNGRVDAILMMANI